MTRPNRLIITVPVQGKALGFARVWPAIDKILRNHLHGMGKNDMYGDFLSTGLPYHLPFSFSQEEAESFAQDLKAAGCDVLIVPSGE